MAKQVPQFVMEACIEKVNNKTSKAGNGYSTIQVMDIGVNFEKFVDSDKVSKVENGEKHRITFAPEMDGRNIIIGNIVDIELIKEVKKNV